MLLTKHFFAMSLPGWLHGSPRVCTFQWFVSEVAYLLHSYLLHTFVFHLFSNFIAVYFLWFYCADCFIYFVTLPLVIFHVFLWQPLWLLHFTYFVSLSPIIFNVFCDSTTDYFSCIFVTTTLIKLCIFVILLS